MYLQIPFTSLVDWNSAATVNLTFDNYIENDNTSGTPTFVAMITTGSAPYSTLTCNTTRTYRFDVAAALSNTTGHTSQLSFRLLVNGTVAGPALFSTVLPSAVTGTSGINTIYGSIYRTIGQGQTVGFLASRVQGTGAMTSTSIHCNVFITLVDTAY